MPHAIAPGEDLRADAPRLTRLVLAKLKRPDLAAATAIPFDKPEYFEDMAARVASGDVRALGFYRAGKLVGQLFYHIAAGVFRIHGAHAMPGLEAGEAWNACMPMIEHFARSTGCRAITTDTSRPGVLLAHVADGFEVAEVILTKKL